MQLNLFHCTFDQLNSLLDFQMRDAPKEAFYRSLSLPEIHLQFHQNFIWNLTYKTTYNLFHIKHLKSMINSTVKTTWNGYYMEHGGHLVTADSQCIKNKK